MGENPTQQPKNLLNYPTKKISFIKFTSSAFKYVIFSPSKSDFHLITLYEPHLQLQPWLLYHFLTSGFMHICVLPTLINRYLLNVVFDMTKVLNGQSSPKKNFYSLHISILLGKPFLSLCLFSPFSTPFFISNFMKLQLTPLQLGLRGLSAYQI